MSALTAAYCFSTQQKGLKPVGRVEETSVEKEVNRAEYAWKVFEFLCEKDCVYMQ